MHIDDHLMIVCGPSGSGKTTLVRHLMKCRENVAESVSHTTRPMREGEVDGVDYHFVTSDEFEEIEFVERAVYHGRNYGTARETLKKLAEEGKDIAAVVDYHGVESLLTYFPKATVVLVLVPSLEEMRLRLSARGDRPAAIDSRVYSAREEMSRAIRKATHLVMNDSLVNSREKFVGVYDEMVRKRH